TPQEIAHVLHTKFDLGLNGGMLITNPIPESHSMKSELIDEVIDHAIIEMDNLGIKGKEQTPFLLGKIVELTEGKSLESNIALGYNNCKLAGQIGAYFLLLND
ncbi:MAG: pseudouridine-5-phosphate glycosidase, partial [Bacteroidales bacterium]|nr:pseudouridine-5-phosphate glycosidase [Bacteroidales bacterium]